MRILKSNPLLNLGNSYLIDSPQPSNLSYSWNFGSLLASCLVIQIITGVTLAMHYNPSVLEAFNSVEHIMRDVNNGWLIRYLHSNTASAFFFIVYLHIGRGLYYGSYRAPRTIVWTIGTIILVVMMATAFLGYVLPYGQMSLWGATVITNLMSAIPWIGQDIVEFIWGGFSVNNATLNRFFSLHFVLPFVLAALALMHLIALHDISGSGNPLGVSGNYDRIPFAPYYIFKDLITIFLLILVLSLFVFFMPNVLGDSENYIMANPMQTPPAIVPEWYLLPFYAILRSIPNKLLGVIAMFSAILILLILPIVDMSKFRGLQFKPISKMAFWIFLANFLILMQLGAKHVESPFIEFGQLSTILYFSYFLIIVPLITYFENTIIQLNSEYNIPSYYKTNVLNITMSAIFPYIKKHLTINNFIIGMFGLLVACLFRFSPLAEFILEIFHIKATELNQFILAGSVGLIFRLAIRGFVEAMELSFDKPLLMNINDILNPVEQGQGQALSPAVKYEMWKSYSFIGNNFSVRNGVITVNNPEGLSKFFDGNNQPDTSPAAKALAADIARALQHHSDFFGVRLVGVPMLDSKSSSWLNGFFKYTYPSRSGTAYWNSREFRAEINKFSSNPN